MNISQFTMLFAITLISSCISIKDSTNSEKYIVGKWCLLDEKINYPTITFTEDSLAVLGSRMDTIYYYKYFVNGNYLHLMNFENKNAKIPILTFTRDSLILGSLLENKEIQTYYKCGTQ